MPVDLIRRAPGSPRLATRDVRGRAERMLRALEVPRAELSVLLTNDRGIRALNREHRKKDRPTDVLAFPLEEAPSAPGGPRLLGDVVISLDTAARQARARKVRFMDEVTFLLAHGLLHLVGLDHRTDAEERRMTRETERLVEAATSKKGPGGGKPRQEREQARARRR